MGPSTTLAGLLKTLGSLVGRRGDVWVVGAQNSGKSSLINSLRIARKVIPSVGSLHPASCQTLTICFLACGERFAPCLTLTHRAPIRIPLETAPPSQFRPAPLPDPISAFYCASVGRGASFSHPPPPKPSIVSFPSTPFYLVASCWLCFNPRSPLSYQDLTLYLS